MPKLTGSKRCGNAEQREHTLRFTPTAKRAVTVAKSLGFEGNFEDAQLRTSTQDAVFARMAVWYGIRATGKSLPQIGRMTGGFDHTTVLHGLKRAKEIHDPHKLDQLAAIMSGQDAEDVPTPKQVKRTDRNARIHAYWKRGHSLGATAKYFDVSKETVRRVVSELEPSAPAQAKEQGA